MPVHSLITGVLTNHRFNLSVHLLLTSVKQNGHKTEQNKQRNPNNIKWK